MDRFFDRDGNSLVPVGFLVSADRTSYIAFKVFPTGQKKNHRKAYVEFSIGSLSRAYRGSDKYLLLLTKELHRLPLTTDTAAVGLLREVLEEKIGEGYFLIEAAYPVTLLKTPWTQILKVRIL
jgi:hypothetical protein